MLSVWFSNSPLYSIETPPPKKNPRICGKRVIVEQNGVTFGTRGWYKYWGHLVHVRFLALLCATELLGSPGRPSSVLPSSVKPAFSEPVTQINAKFVERYLFTISPDHFLALLDYVSRAHEIEICFYRNLFFVRRPSLSQLSLNLMHWFF